MGGAADPGEGAWCCALDAAAFASEVLLAGEFERTLLVLLEPAEAAPVGDESPGARVCECRTAEGRSWTPRGNCAGCGSE
jgi:hypothetical protein